MFKRVIAYLFATIVTAGLACIASTQSVLSGLSRLGAELSLGIRFQATVHDLGGMGPIYAALVAAGFVVALPVAGLLTRLLPRARLLLFALAGAATIAVIILAMKAIFGITTIAGARGSLGFAAQVACGAVGGFFFAYVTREHPTHAR